MSDISIDKKTGISIGLLMVIAPVVFWGITAWTRVQAQTDRNTSDITAVLAKLDTLNDNLNKTNGNIIELSTKLDALSARANTPASTITGSSTNPVSVTYLQPTSTVQPQTDSTPSQVIDRPQQGQQPADKPSEQSSPQSPAEYLVTVITKAVQALN